jgi:hypothetical protein
MKICKQKIHNIVANLKSFNATKVKVKVKLKQDLHKSWGFQEVDAPRI